MLGLRWERFQVWQWQDVDLLKGRPHIWRDVCQYGVDEVKTSASAARLQLAPEVMGELGPIAFASQSYSIDRLSVCQRAENQQAPTRRRTQGDGAVLE